MGNKPSLNYSINCSLPSKTDPQVNRATFSPKTSYNTPATSSPNPANPPSSTTGIWFISEPSPKLLKPSYPARSKLAGFKNWPLIALISDLPSIGRSKIPLDPKKAFVSPSHSRVSGKCAAIYAKDGNILPVC